MNEWWDWYPGGDGKIRLRQLRQALTYCVDRGIIHDWAHAPKEVKMGWLARRRRAWFEREFGRLFDQWFQPAFNRSFERGHICVTNGASQHQEGLWLKRIMRELGLVYHPRTYFTSWYCEPDERERPSLEERVRRLECPKHDYHSDKCVKCGAPKRGGDAPRKRARR